MSTYPDLTRQTVRRQTFTSRRRSTNTVCIQFAAIAIATGLYVGLTLLPLNLWRVMQNTDLVIFVGWLLLTVFLFPRFIGFPPKIVTYDPSTFPVLNEIVAQIAATVGVPAPTILVTEQHMAAFARLGWRRRSVISIGYPLLTTLTKTEVVQLLTHEIAHTCDKAITRSLYVRIAYGALLRWENALRPQRFWLVFKPVAFVLYWLPRPLFLALEWCIIADHKSAEHWVDSVAVRVAGARLSAELFLKIALRYHPIFAQQYYSACPSEKYHLARSAYHSMNVKARRQLKQFMLSDHAQPSPLHPPIAERLARQADLPFGYPHYTVTSAQYDALHQELQRWPDIFAEREASLY